MFHGYLGYFQNHLFEVGTSDAHNCWFILFYHVREPAWIEIPWNNIWLRAWSHVTSHYTWWSVTMTFRHFLLGSHNFMITALGSCVKWPSLFKCTSNCKWPLEAKWSLEQANTNHAIILKLGYGDHNLIKTSATWTTIGIHWLDMHDWLSTISSNFFIMKP